MNKYEIEDGEDTKKILNRLGSKIKSKNKASHDKIVIEIDSSDEDALLGELNNNSIDYTVK